MANQHFNVDTGKAFGLKLAKLVRDCADVLDDAASLKYVADEVTAGGVNTTSEEFQTLFGLESSNAGAALYPLLQSIMAGTLTRANFVEFDQGL